MIEIDKNIEIPVKGCANYPFKHMEIGDSFIVDVENVAAFRNRTYIAAKELNFKFSTLKTEDGSYRCWRIK